MITISKINGKGQKNGKVVNDLGLKPEACGLMASGGEPQAITGALLRRLKPAAPAHPRSMVEKPVLDIERTIPRMVFPTQPKVNSEFFRMQIKSGFC